MFCRAIRLPTGLATLYVASAVHCLGQQPATSNNENDVTRLSQLIAIVESSAHPDRDLAIRALSELKTQAGPAIPSLCKLLDDPQHGTRANAVDALVAIGNNTVKPLRELTHAQSGRCRAAAATALGRLGHLEPDELERFATDDDPRVRSAAVQALTGLGKTGATRLVAMLADTEESIAVEAARGLRENHADSAAAIAALIQMLSRPRVGGAAAEALSSYGVQAQRAVPWIIKVYPLGEPRQFSWDDAAEDALEHIGPPHPDDIPLLIECLSHQELEARIR